MLNLGITPFLWLVDNGIFTVTNVACRWRMYYKEMEAQSTGIKKIVRLSLFNDSFILELWISLARLEILTSSQRHTWILSAHTLYKDERCGEFFGSGFLLQSVWHRRFLRYHLFLSSPWMRLRQIQRWVQRGRKVCSDRCDTVAIRHCYWSVWFLIYRFARILDLSWFVGSLSCRQLMFGLVGWLVVALVDLFFYHC